MRLTRVRLLVATLWAGSLWTVGYLVAPTLFATLADRVLAGTVAASMFRSEAWLSIACALGMLALLARAKELDAKRRRLLVVLAVAVLVCTLVVQFGLQPMMAELRTGGEMAPAAKTRFGILHGISSVIYLVQSLLAGFLVIRNA
jgi:hypothetical protein